MSNASDVVVLSLPKKLAGSTFVPVLGQSMFGLPPFVPRIWLYERKPTGYDVLRPLVFAPQTSAACPCVTGNTPM